MAAPNELSASEIGHRLRLARKNARIRQVEAAKVIGLSRPTLVAIEKGDRQIEFKNSKHWLTVTGCRSTQYIAEKRSTLISYPDSASCALPNKFTQKKPYCSCVT